MYPPDPGEKPRNQGGNVFTNAGGMRAVKHGTTRDYVRGMTRSSDRGDREGGRDGLEDEFGAPAHRVGGYAWHHHGDDPEDHRRPQAMSIIVPYETLEGAIATVPKLFAANLDPQALEFMEKDVVIDTEKLLC